jgi:tRNA 2-thiocytidine biosynthesis protein TtcA
LPCNLCGSQSEAQRKHMKALIGELERSNPTVRQTMLAALGNVVPTHLLDRDFAGVAATTSAPPETPLLQIARAASGPHRGG